MASKVPGVPAKLSVTYTIPHLKVTGDLTGTPGMNLKTQSKLKL